jgi:dCMP deaminase
MAIAFIASQRSHDKQTQHGCVIADKDNRILGIGYNGFPRAFDDEQMSKDGFADRPATPDAWPSKYPFMRHSERNALANCEHRPKGGIAYVTGQCCNECAQELWQHGVKKIVMANRHGSVLIGEREKMIWDIFLKETGIEIQYVQPKLDFAIDYLNKVKE